MEYFRPSIERNEKKKKKKKERQVEATTHKNNQSSYLGQVGTLGVFE